MRDRNRGRVTTVLLLLVLSLAGLPLLGNAGEKPQKVCGEFSREALVKAVFGDDADTVKVVTEASELMAADHWDSPVILVNESTRPGILYLGDQAFGHNEPLVKIPCASLSRDMLDLMAAIHSQSAEPMLLTPDRDVAELSAFEWARITSLVSIDYGVQAPASAPASPQALLDYIQNAPPHARMRGAAESLVQEVFFTTDRLPASDRPDYRYYSGKRNHEGLQYGSALVRFPEDHQVGNIEKPGWFSSMENNPEDYVTVKQLDKLTAASFFARLSTEHSGEELENSILVFVHGYNVSFRNGLLRLAQMAFDFGYPGKPVLFSWPSDGELAAYASDREDATWSARHFADFLSGLKQENPDKTIHIIAHSMGSQVLLGGLHQLALASDKPASLFDNVILAAPDYDSELFAQQVFDTIRPLAEQWTLYSSERDGALIVSRELNRNPRLGKNPVALQYLNAVDTSNFKTSPWDIPNSHSYVMKKMPVIEDIVAVLEGKSVDERMLITKPDGEGYTLGGE